MGKAKNADVEGIPLSSGELRSRCRSLAAAGMITLVAVQLFHKSGTYADVFQYHPICMMLAFVMVMPDVVSGIKRLRRVSQRVPSKTGHTVQPLNHHLPRDEIIMRHQLATFAMELAAAGGFAAVEYTKITHSYQHLKSPHGIVGALCGVAIVCQIVLGSILRYVLSSGDPKRPMVRTAHKYVSATIAVTGMMALAGGVLATEYAEKMFPSLIVRVAITVASVLITCAGFVM
ncbi:hypothetical protein JKF63_02987 [Porcisia hertigi]|uniref:Cytochrome b561 domain-containing protein n=1 Tax=Porcisia hertigi TaxID=2761500 RepID=A0A836HW99_9TRYP|nr:hypothetical protein JKF63_02987 [Porcisia hertigi]